MDYSYEFTELAINDINDALTYITTKLNNPKAANDLLSEIENNIGKVCLFPLSYPNCKYFFINDESIRHVIIKNYVLVFKIYKSKIIFLRFKYSKQNRIL